jgi:hypothetical protein
MTAPKSRILNERARLLIGAVNVVGAVAAAAFAAGGLARPGYVHPGSASTPNTRFWAASSAVRMWAVAVPLVVDVIADRQAKRHLLVVAGLVQLGDSALGLWQRKAAMTVAPAIMGVVHFASARCLRLAEIDDTL